MHFDDSRGYSSSVRLNKSVAMESKFAVTDKDFRDAVPY